MSSNISHTRESDVTIKRQKISDILYPYTSKVTLEIVDDLSSYSKKLIIGFPKISSAYYSMEFDPMEFIPPEELVYKAALYFRSLPREIEPEDNIILSDN